MQKVVILDRDGVINKKPPKAHYVKTWDEFQLLPGVIEALQFLTEKDYKIIIVTNQAGIARNFMTDEDLQIIHKNLLKLLKKNGITIHHIYYCPHGWDDGCYCRKPKPGMLLQAAEEYDFDLKDAIFIGDDPRDKETGDAVGCRTILIPHDGNLVNIVKTIANP